MASTEKKNTRKSKSQIAANAQRIKVAVRKLPPTLPEETFWKSCEQWVNPNTIRDKWFRPGNLKGARFSPQSIMSRAYIAFNHPEQLATFSNNYDGHIFRDKQGNEYAALVSYAPSQKLPANPKVDQRQGTIDDDDEYKSFLALLEKGEDPAASKREKEIYAITQDPSKPESTPLLDALLTAAQSKNAHSKSASNAKGSGHKSSVSKSQKAAAQKAAKEDDIYFSRAQPIVPSGPVTLLTPSKAASAAKGDKDKERGGSQKPAVSPVAPKSPLPRQAEKYQGKGKGKEVPKPTSKEQSQQSKDQAPASSTAASGPASTPKKSAAPAGDDTQTTPKGSKRKKKPSITTKPGEAPAGKAGNENAPAGSTNAGNSTSTSAPANHAPAKNDGRDRGKGRGGRGGSRGGPPVVVIPKILTKALQQEAAKANTPTKGSSAANTTTLAAPTSTSESKSAPTTTSANQGAPADGSTNTRKTEGESGSAATPAPTPAVGETASQSKDEDAAPSDAVESKSTRGSDRSRRPFFRGRGRGRGRGGPKPSVASSETT